jgi:hypothetical protein
MKESTKQILLDAWDWCDDEDKSTEFMLQYMSDVANIEYESVVDYIASNESNLDRAIYYETLQTRKE